MSDDQVRALLARIAALSPASKLILASQLVDRAPEVAAPIAQQAVDALTARLPAAGHRAPKTEAS